MIYFDDTTLMFLSKIYENSNVPEMLEKKLFRAADTGLSYRQLQELEKAGLLRSERASNKEWRRYDLTGVTSISIIAKLKDYGFTFAQLMTVTSFLHETDVELEAVNKSFLLVDAIALCVIAGMPIYLILTDDTVIGIFDSPDLASFIKNPTENAKYSYLVIDATSLVQEVLATIDKRLVSQHEDLHDIAALTQFSNEEKSVVKAMRSGLYSSVEVVMRNGQIGHLNLKESLKNRKDKLTQKDVLELLVTKQYGSISAHLEGGKIVNLVGVNKVKV
jgi:DNA-binding transcriptional MerR regulator